MRPALRLAATPRSASDATRFTATTLHATSKTATPPPRFTPPRPGAASSTPGGLGGSGGSGDAGDALFETPEQKVARLRAAHQRAKAAQVSKFDAVVDHSRRFFDSAHKITVVGLIGFTVVAGVVTAYTAYDMIRYNKKRAAEWAEAQMKLEADSLEAARIAYMTGKATEEQITLVEEQLERERESGRQTTFFSNLSVLGSPEPTTASSSSTPSTPPQPPHSVTETVSWPPKDASPDQQQPADAPQDQPKTSVWSWITSGLKTDETDSSSSSNSTPSSGNQSSILSTSASALQAKAQSALDQEKANQQRGGPFDKIGGAPATEGAGETGKQDDKGGEKKKGWW
ncbi:cytochrome oxidase c assembly-domain-containing protein [Chaetomium sp. MPI-SDFR-AT-0129]|nr:cytochrome oxidase c assembly-domain-containing protein [Chaetomium sp. MPI-SDFR-AT-0129]